MFFAPNPNNFNTSYFKITNPMSGHYEWMEWNEQTDGTNSGIVE